MKFLMSIGYLPDADDEILRQQEILKSKSKQNINE